MKKGSKVSAYEELKNVHPLRSGRFALQTCLDVRVRLGAVVKDKLPVKEGRFAILSKVTKDGKPFVDLAVLDNFHEGDTRQIPSNHTFEVFL